MGTHSVNHTRYFPPTNPLSLPPSLPPPLNHPPSLPAYQPTMAPSYLPSTHPHPHHPIPLPTSCCPLPRTTLSEYALSFSQDIDDFFKCRRTAEQYYSYQSIHKYTDEPFTALTPDTVFNISRFLLSWLLKDEAPYGISKAYCIFAMAKQAKTLGAHKLARFALEKLSQYKVPLSWQEQVRDEEMNDNLRRRDA